MSQIKRDLVKDSDHRSPFRTYYVNMWVNVKPVKLEKNLTLRIKMFRILLRLYLYVILMVTHE